MAEEGVREVIAGPGVTVATKVFDAVLERVSVAVTEMVPVPSVEIWLATKGTVRVVAVVLAAVTL